MTIAVDLGCKATKQINQPKHVVGTQKNRLTETVLLSTQNICYNLWVRKYSQFDAQILFLSIHMYV